MVLDFLCPAGCWNDAGGRSHHWNQVRTINIQDRKIREAAPSALMRKIFFFQPLRCKKITMCRRSVVWTQPRNYMFWLEPDVWGCVHNCPVWFGPNQKSPWCGTFELMWTSIGRANREVVSVCLPTSHHQCVKARGRRFLPVLESHTFLHATSLCSHGHHGEYGFC